MERTKVQEKAYRVIDMIATGKRITEHRIEHGYSVSDLQKYFGFEAPQKVQKAMNSTLSGLQEEDWLNNEWIPMVTKQ